MSMPPGPELCVVVPTFNEAGNVAVLVERLGSVLAGIDWEIVFVDDDSPDGTAERVREIGRTDRRVRCIRRIGRRGLSSASIEGILSTSADLVAVMDGDLQHDESLLPRMVEQLRSGRGRSRRRQPVCRRGRRGRAVERRPPAG